MMMKNISFLQILYLLSTGIYSITTKNKHFAVQFGGTTTVNTCIRAKFKIKIFVFSTWGVNDKNVLNRFIKL